MTERQEKELIFVDTETTGLDSSLHEIIEICIIDIDGNVLIDTKVKPDHIETAQPRALTINGYTEEGWVDAPPASSVFATVAKIFDKSKVEICGQNTQFDMAFVKATMARLKIGTADLPYSYLDLKTLAYAVLKPRGLDSTSLGPICNFLGITLDPHRAHNDIEATRLAWLQCTKIIRGAAPSGRSGS